MRCSRSLYFSMLFSVCMSGTFMGVAFLSPCLLSLDAEWCRSLSCLPLEEWESEDLESKEWLLFSSPVLTLLEDLFPSDLSYKVNKDYVWFIVWYWFFGFIFLLTFPCCLHFLVTEAEEHNILSEKTHCGTQYSKFISKLFTKTLSCFSDMKRFTNITWIQVPGTMSLTDAPLIMKLMKCYMKLRTLQN